MGRYVGYLSLVLVFYSEKSKDYLQVEGVFAKKTQTAEEGML